jgi:hypothetical protein
MSGAGRTVILRAEGLVVRLFISQMVRKPRVYVKCSATGLRLKVTGSAPPTAGGFPAFVQAILAGRVVAISGAAGEKEDADRTEISEKEVDAASVALQLLSALDEKYPSAAAEIRRLYPDTLRRAAEIRRLDEAARSATAVAEPETAVAAPETAVAK